ncbi:MAG TPA: polyprenyl synthetase family protein [Thermoanaerobaculia bacterium]|nr:polyprenyl synthetase family protein [Thermoanaerobaculia bacterium]
MSREDAGRARPASAPRDGAELIGRTVDLLAQRAPSILADAARELGLERLVLRFTDGSRALLQADHNALRVHPCGGEEPTVECLLSDASLRRLFDLERRPAELLSAAEFDTRGPTEAVLACWRTFQILAQRAAGLRVIQAVWTDYSRRIPQPPEAAAPEHAPPGPYRPYPDAAALLRDTEESAARTASVAATRVLWDGRGGAGWWTVCGPRDADLFEVMETCQRRALEEVDRLLPRREPRAALYDLMRDYPSRGGKGLRATLCMASCGAFGGRAEDAVRTAAAVEMFHNAFLIHDDIEDESRSRRGTSCLHGEHGIPLAINAGDALHLQAVETVLSNIERLGLARTLGLIHEVIRMCRETVEGQAIELGWIRSREVPSDDDHYVHMVVKKTGWYTCISPCRLGAIAAGHTRPRDLDLLGRVFEKVGVAFQIQDDVLNLVGEESLYGKEILGDLLEGKRTLMLIHLMRSLRGRERGRVLRWLARPRGAKDLDGARRVASLLEREGSIEYGRAVAARYAAEAESLFESELGFLPESESKALLRQVVHFVNTREL